jgi:DNA excision repair protein ERCC-2
MTNSEFNDYCKVMVREERCRFYNNTRTKNHVLTQNSIQLINNLKSKQPIHAEDAKELCHDACCTYELLTELAKQSTVIIGDYYHIFSPLSKTMFARIKKELKDSIIIVDEAHNLPQRVRDLASRRTSTYSLSMAEKEARAFGFNELQSTLRELAAVLNVIKREKLQRQKECFIEKNYLIGLIEKNLGPVSDVIEDFLSASESVLENKKKSYIGNTGQFISSWCGDEEGYCRIASLSRLRSGKDVVTISYKCLDPTIFTKGVVEDSHSTILMSGTLFPMEMYRDLLGLRTDRALMRSYQSPFPRHNRLNIFVRGVTTQYTKRTSENFIKIADYVSRCCNTITGNVAVFFPSYYLRDVVYELAKSSIKKEMLLEQQNSNKADRRKLYELFVSRHEKGAVFFGVMAGSFSEGMDYPGKFLNGVIVVGIPLEIPNLECKALIEYYDTKFKRGWDYGYIYPAMTRSIQAAGRCIRSADDRGVCVFIDDRFLWGNYRKVFPSDLLFKITNEPEKEIRTFFSQTE